MCRSTKWSMWFVLLLIVAFTACAPAATPVPPAATVVPPTATNPPPTLIPPTATNLPTSTPAPKPTKTPNPKFFEGKFDAGGVNLYIACYGIVGSPTVVLDAGLGRDSEDWIKIIPKIMLHTRICAYDRASMGQSDSQSGLRTSGQMADQLHALLGNAGVKGPYILVGSSLGGMNMLVFANRYQDETAGLVLVDSAHPDQADRWLAILPTPSPSEDISMTNLRKDIAWSNPEDQSFPEPMNWDEPLAQVRAVKSLSSLPLAVLVHGSNNPNILTQWYSGQPDDLIAKQEQVWLDLHKEQAALSSDGQLIVAKKSGHAIQDDEPQVVIDAILGLVDKARQK